MVFLMMLLERLKGFLAYIVLHSAGIFHSRLRGDADADEVAGKKLMALINALCDLSSRISKMDESIIISCYISAGFELLHSNAYTWLTVAQVIYDINRSDLRLLVVQDQYSLEIILG